MCTVHISTFLLIFVHYFEHYRTNIFYRRADAINANTISKELTIILLLVVDKNRKRWTSVKIDSIKASKKNFRNLQAYLSLKNFPYIEFARGYLKKEKDIYIFFFLLDVLF